MNAFNRMKVLGGAAVLVLAGCAMMSGAKEVNVTANGAQEVPPVSSGGNGKGSIIVNEDHTVSGSITLAGLSPVAGHIHVGARGKNGPVAIGLTKSSEGVWVVPAGAKFNDDQYKAFLAGDTYVNFHTPAHKGGEIRAQLQP